LLFMFLHISPLYGVDLTVESARARSMSGSEERNKKALTFTRDACFARQLTQV